MRYVLSLAVPALLGGALLTGPAHAALQLEPLTSFGTSGWLAPGTHPFITTDHTLRGMAYNADNNRLYVVSRGPALGVHVLDGTTGAHLHSLDLTGISGGFFAASMIGVGADGAIYAGNLTLSADDPFRIYRWADDSPATAPTAAFAVSTGLSRTGDTFAVIGSGADTRIIASGSGHAGIAVFDTTDGVSYTMTSADTISGVAAGGFRLGLAFIDPNTAIGQATGTTQINVANLGTSAGEVFNVNVTGEAPLAYYAADQLLATIDVATSDVRLYDASDLSLLTSSGFMHMNNLTTSLVANTNGTGDVAFGIGPDGILRLYALNTNNGIQAFEVIPEPSTALLAGLGMLGLLARRARR